MTKFSSTSTSISVPMKQRSASCGVQTIGSPRTLKLVLISTGLPVRSWKRRIIAASRGLRSPSTVCSRAE